jgi:exodeoxyribonuclease VII large subunit
MTQPIFTVTEVVRDAKASLESMYPYIGVKGEISNLNLHSSGHAYFSLKDPGAQISAVMFADDVRRMRFRPENGLQVILQGRLTVYPPQGRFQMVASAMEPQGKGGLQLAFEQLKAKLEKEGLFDAGRKKPIPALPQWIGLVTSLDGAALHDMLSVLNRRFANIRILIHPVKVQGEGAAREIAEAIRRLNNDYPALEVLLVGRGGGSIEDLWAFNEEIVARAIAASTIPIISCIGHETDFTIADFVADLRAATPSAAAELVTRAKSDLYQQLATQVVRLRSAMEYQIHMLEQRLQHAMDSRMLQKPLALIEEHLQDVDALRDRLAQVARNRVDHWDKDLRHLFEKLHLLSPLATLSRGYAITWKLPERRILKSAAAVQSGDSIEVQLQQGTIYAQVERSELRDKS